VHFITDVNDPTELHRQTGVQLMYVADGQSPDENQYEDPTWTSSWTTKSSEVVASASQY